MRQEVTVTGTQRQVDMLLHVGKTLESNLEYHRKKKTRQEEAMENREIRLLS